MTITQICFSPFGIGTTIPTGDPPDAVEVGVRYLNPATRDYQIDSATGQQAQMGSKLQRVLLAILTLQNSMTVDTGRGISPPRAMTPTFATEMQQAVQYALRELTEVEKAIVLKAVHVLPGQSGRALVTIEFIDIDTGEEVTTPPTMVG